MRINPLTITMNRHHLELVLEVAETRLAKLKEGSPAHEALLWAVLNLKDEITAAVAKKESA
jgi:hypothetical protein